MENIISALLLATEIYLAAGVLFAIYFLSKGIYQLDEGAKGSSFFFKLIIAPGVIVLWILLLKKIINLKSK